MVALTACSPPPTGENQDAILALASEVWDDLIHATSSLEAQGSHNVGRPPINHITWLTFAMWRNSTAALVCPEWVRRVAEFANVVNGPCRR